MSGGSGHYARSVEKMWSDLLERPVVLSPREWEIVSDWHARGIPLELVAEAIDEARQRVRRGRRAPRSLGYLAGAVEESWQAIVEGRSEAREPSRKPRETTGVESWRTARDAAGDTELGRLLSDLLAALERGVDPEEIERRLDEALIAAVPDELRRRHLRQLRGETEALGRTLRPDVRERSERRALQLRLRGELGLAPLEGPAETG